MEALAVAPLTGAWIETSAYLREFLYSVVAPLTGAWIETAMRTRLITAPARRAPHGRVD